MSRPNTHDGILRDAVLFGTNAVHGYIYGDMKKRFPDGELVHISKVLEVWFDKPGDDILRTKNTVYQVVWAHNMRPTFGSDVKVHKARKAKTK